MKLKLDLSQIELFDGTVGHISVNMVQLIYMLKDLKTKSQFCIPAVKSKDL